ncbi:MAG: hypothetical protein ACYCXG_12025 [Acidiferrobacter sp.]
MYKIRLTAILMALVLISGPAFANSMKPMGSPMKSAMGSTKFHRWHAPTVPMLLPLAEMRSYALHLSNKQVARLAVWRNDHMRKVIPDMHKMWQDKRALRQSILAGQSEDRIHTIAERLSADRAELLQMKVAQAEMVHRTLSARQWQQLITFYHRMQMMHRGPDHRR